jgi:hypothetical protein
MVKEDLPSYLRAIVVKDLTTVCSEYTLWKKTHAYLHVSACGRWREAPDFKQELLTQLIQIKLTRHAMGTQFGLIH